MHAVTQNANIPFITTDQMREVDRAMMEDYGIDLAKMMENAGRELAHLARSRFLGGNPKRKRVAVLAGTEGNGGGGLVCARRLNNWGANVTVRLSSPTERLTEVPRHQLSILERMGVPINSPSEGGILHSWRSPGAPGL